jgi:hypothetical protein
MRRIVVNGAEYLFGVSHRHPSNGRCEEIFTAYLADHKRSPLRIRFTGAPGYEAGYPSRGVVGRTDPDASLNLNTPGVAASIIRRARELGWDPVSGATAFIIADGFAVFLPQA